MRIDLVERQPVRVACLHYTGVRGAPLGRFWRATVAPWLADHDLVDCPRFGVNLDDPLRPAPENFRYDACIELPRGLSLPDTAETIIPGGRYAITYFKGDRARVDLAWGAFG